MRRSFQFQRLDRARAVQLLAWRYPPPYDFYNARDLSETAVAELLRPELNYFSVLDEAGELIAFRCFGTDAQVAGGDYRAPALDLGGGLRPELTGQGLGRPVIAAAMEFALAAFQPRLFRTTTATFNLRAQRACLRLGFAPAENFVRPSDGVAFVVLTRRAA